MLNTQTEVKTKNVSSTKYTDSELNKSKCNLVKGPKPLQKFKFYLDLKNHAASSKLENKIKELGGVVEFFLVEEVTHVISDRPQCPEVKPGCSTGTNSPVTPSPSSAYTKPSVPKPGRLRLKTRSDAMLEKVRSQSTREIRDPLENAKRWGIPIWTLNKVFLWLDKVSASITVTSATKPLKVIQINAPFIKFEPYLRNARPFYKTLSAWPVIDLDSTPGKSPFTQTKTVNLPVKNNKKDASETETNDANMTRKQRTRLSVRSGIKAQEVEKLVGGYCEICHCEYRELSEHVRSEQHLNFVKNDANFLELDSLISAGANVEAFLRLNGTTTKDLYARRSLRRLNGKSPEKCNGDAGVGHVEEYSPPVTRMTNRMPRTRASLQSPLSPTGSESGGHQLRSRGSLWLPSNLVGTTAEDDAKKKLKSDEDNNKVVVVEEVVGKVRKSLKRISADERLVADNKSYYKVEVMTTKLRSSGLGTREIEVTTRRAQTPIPEEAAVNDQNDDADADDDEKSLVFKFKRIRRSELSALNNEAENFMFPKKEDSDASEGDTDLEPNETQSTVKSDSFQVVSSSPAAPAPIKSEPDAKCSESSSSSEDSLSSNSSSTTTSSSHTYDYKRKRAATRSEGEGSCESGAEEGKRKRKKLEVVDDVDVDETSQDSVDSECCGGKKQRKRRTQAETFLADNQRYYKFQTPGSRLRYQGTLFPAAGGSPKSPTPAKTNGDLTEEPIEPDELAPEPPEPELTAESLKFSFEFQPRSEPWYQTFQRQDQGAEIYTSVSDPGYYSSRFILPYQLPLVQPLDPKVCLDNYKQKRQLYFNRNRDESATEGDKTGEECTTTTTGSSGESSQMAKARRRRKRRLITKLNSNHPRKSPRQHASTLAILSSLIHQRKKRERKAAHHHQQLEGGGSADRLAVIKEETAAGPDVVVNTREDREETKADLLSDAIIEEILTAPMDDLSDLDIQDGVQIWDKPDAIDLLEHYDQISPDLLKSHITPGRLDSTNVRNRRKRKKNRTGWPKKKRLFPVRKTKKLEDSNAEDTTNTVEDVGPYATSDGSELTELLNNNSEKSPAGVATALAAPIDASSEVSENYVSPSTTTTATTTTTTSAVAAEQRCLMNVTLDKWDNAEKVLQTKMNENDKIFQPFVRVQKIDNNSSALQNINRRLRSSSSPERKPKAKRARISAPTTTTTPAQSSTSPRSPRRLRAPRGKWYRER